MLVLIAVVAVVNVVAVVVVVVWLMLWSGVGGLGLLKSRSRQRTNIRMTSRRSICARLLRNSGTLESYIVHRSLRAMIARVTPRIRKWCVTAAPLRCGRKVVVAKAAAPRSKVILDVVMHISMKFRA